MSTNPSESLNPYGAERYVFTRNALSSVRLNYQHLIFTDMLGGDLLHKSVKDIVDFSTAQRVADLGTGTALWPISLATSHPNWQVDGFDISGDQYPPSARVPANVGLYVHDTFQPYPEEYHGKYDIVNVRFLMTVLSREKFHLLLQHAKQLLKPGGIFQWFEPNSPLTKAIAPEGVSTEHTATMANMMVRVPPDGPEWNTSNCAMVKPAGFEPITSEEFHFKDMHHLMWMQCVLMGSEEVIQSLEDSKDEAAVAKSNGFKKLTEGIQAEIAQGACLEAPWFMLTARKPL